MRSVPPPTVPAPDPGLLLLCRDCGSQTRQPHTPHHPPRTRHRRHSDSRASASCRRLRGSVVRPSRLQEACRGRCTAPVAVSVSSPGTRPNIHASARQMSEGSRGEDSKSEWCGRTVGGDVACMRSRERVSPGPGRAKRPVLGGHAQTIYFWLKVGSGKCDWIKSNASFLCDAIVVRLYPSVRLLLRILIIREME